MKIIFEINFASGEEHKFTVQEIKEALTNTQVDYTSRNSLYHSAHEVRRCIRQCLAQSKISIENDINIDDCFEKLSNKELLEVCVSFNLLTYDQTNYPWTKAGIKALVKRKMDTPFEFWKKIRSMVDVTK